MTTQLKAKQILVVTVITYILAGFTKPFQTAFEVSKGISQSNNILTQLVDYHGLMCSNLGLIDTVLYNLGRLTAFIVF